MLMAVLGLIALAIVWLPGPVSVSAAPADTQLDIVVVLDNSGSMITNDPDFIIRKVTTDFIQKLGAGVRLGMVIFDTQANLAEPLAAIEAPETRPRLLESLAQVDYQGQYTNTPAAVERALYELKSNGNPEALQFIILLTDGIVDTGNKADDIESERWLKESLTLESKKLGIRIIGIAFTDKADFRLIQTLAVNTDGEYFRAYQAEDIQDIFAKIDQIMTRPPVPEPPAVVQPEIKPMPAPIPSQPIVPVSPPAPAAPPKQLVFLPLLLSAVVVVLGMIVILVLIFNRKGRSREAEVAALAEAAKASECEEPPIEAELIDAENIIASDSKSLILDKSRITVGRDSSNDIVIPKEAISSLHATIEYKNGNFYLEDNRSTNGTLLNDKRMGESIPVRLKSGDKITFAVYEFRFLLPDLAPYGETVMIGESDREKLKAEIEAQKNIEAQDD